jgi:glucoamylase
MVHWSSDGWNTTRDTNSQNTGIGIHVTDLPTEKLPIGTVIFFTFYWSEIEHWEGIDYAVSIV